LIALIAARTFLVFLLIALDFPPTPDHNGWFFHHGGDEYLYFTLAKSLVDLRPVQSMYPLGFPMILAPLIYLFKATVPNDILIPSVVINALIMFNLSIILVALIAEKLTRNKLISLLSATLWTFFPYLSLLMINRYEFIHLMCVQELSDPPSMFFSVLATYIFLLSRERNGRLLAVLAGAMIGFASLIRISNLLLVAVFIFMLIYEKRFKNLAYVAVTAFLVFSPQLIYNSLFFGSPLAFGYQYYLEPGLIETGGHLVFSLAYFPSFFARTIIQTPLVFLSALLGSILLYTYAKRKIETIMLLCWQLSYQVFYSFYWYSEWTMWRFIMPAIPALCVLASSFVLIFDERKVQSIMRILKLRHP